MNREFWGNILDGAQDMYEEEEYGSIKAPKHPLLASAVEGYRGLGKRLEGSPMGLLYDEGLANYGGRLAYGEQPDNWDRLSAGGALADLIPGGAALGAVVPAVAKAKRAAQGVGKSKRRVGSTGKYVGAPSGIESPQALGKMREKYMDLVETGIPGREWYHDSSSWINQTAPPGQRQAVADTLGVSSQGTGVDTNLGFTIKALNQNASGMPVKTGRFPGNQSPLIEEALVGNRSRLGPKRQPFADNLSVSWAPERAQHPVHDIWQGRAFGYTHPNGKPWDAGFSPQQHAFMDEETANLISRANAQELGGFSDWDPLRLQASSWTGAKIDAGDVSVDDAAKHYGDFAQKYKGYGTHEQTPGAGVGHLEELVNAPYDVRAQFNDAGSWTDERGVDSLYSSGGMLAEPTSRSVGAYTPEGTGRLEINPAEVAHPLISYEKGAVRPNEARLMDVGESSRAFVDAQNAGAWHAQIPDSQTKMGDRSSVVLDLNNPSVEQMGRLSAEAADSGMFAVDAGGKVRMINDPYSDIGAARTGTTLGKELKGTLGGRLEDIAGAPGTRAKVQTGYEDYEKLWRAGEGSGQATTKFLSDLDSTPEFATRIEPALQRKAQMNMDRDAAMSAERGWPVREDIQNARRILVDSGYAGLKKALASGALLPAVVAAVLSPELLPAPDEPVPGS